jgi:hypothetical protein
MKKFQKVFLGIVVIVVLGITAVSYFTSDMVKAADGFFNAVKSGDISKAYSYLAQEYIYEGLGWKVLGLNVEIK